MEQYNQDSLTTVSIFYDQVTNVVVLTIFDGKQNLLGFR